MFYMDDMMAYDLTIMRTTDVLVEMFQLKVSMTERSTNYSFILLSRISRKFKVFLVGGEISYLKFSVARMMLFISSVNLSSPIHFLEEDQDLI